MPVADLLIEPDVVIECTGVGQVVIDATHLAAWLARLTTRRLAVQDWAEALQK
jgi:hypothetical protein